MPGNKSAALEAANRLQTLFKDAQSKNLNLDQWKKLHEEAKPLGDTLGQTVKGGAFRDNALGVKKHIITIEYALKDNRLDDAKNAAGEALPDLDVVIRWARS